MTRKQHVQLLGMLGALGALGPFAIDMYLPGFNAIAIDFNTDVAHVGLSLTSYFAGICIGQILVGPLIDRFGRRTPMLIGLSIFALAALGCALAPGLYWLVWLRGVLALGACVGMVASRAIVRDVYHPDEMAKVLSTIMLIMGVAPILAPTVGSFFSSTLGWRWIFGFLTLFSGSLLVGVYFLMPESREPDETVELNAAAIMRDYRLVFRNRDFLVYSLAGGLSMAGLFAYISGAPLLFMKILGLSDSQFAWLFGLNAMGFIGAAQLNRVVLKYVSPQRLILIAGSIAAVAGLGLLLASIAHSTSIVAFSGLIFLFMASLGPLVPNTTALALAPFKKFAGTASALIGSLQMLIAALASGAVSTLANGTSMPMALAMILCMGTGLGLLAWKTLSERRRVTVAPSFCGTSCL